MGQDGFGEVPGVLLRESPNALCPGRSLGSARGHSVSGKASVWFSPSFSGGVWCRIDGFSHAEHAALCFGYKSHLGTVCSLFKSPVELSLLVLW